VTEATAGPVQREIVSWDDLDAHVARLATAVGREFDAILAIARGGLVPAGMLAYRIGIRDILVASIAAYDEDGVRAADPVFLEFPADHLLRGRRILLVDEVWDSGTTIAAAAMRARAAGASVTTAVLHYKPARSLIAERPDHHVIETDAWVVYPFKAGR
jgi:hypoxanthine phosphoribosyltransferase